jgi:hypothetical protein
VRHLTGRAALSFSAAAALGCANRAMQPPGGPVDQTPPRVESVSPESGTVNQRPGAVEFRFSKVVSDQPSRGQLNQYFLISPSDGEPRVNWHRNRIDVRPRRSFRPNTAYTVTLLPGLADVRGNAMKQGATTVFATGATFPRFGIVGSIFDWAAEKPAANALVEAISRPDSTVYLAAPDSLGQFSIGPFGPGRYTLLGFIDRNDNRARDSGEAWDSTTILITTSRPTAELLAIVKDTIPPRMSAAAREDSTTIRVTFDRALDPALPLTPALFRVQRADSTLVPIARVLGAREAAAADSIARRDSTRGDTTTRRDTSAAARAALPPSIVPIPPAPAPTRPAVVVPSPSIAAPPAPRPSRRAPETTLLLRLASPAVLEPGATYRLTAIGVRSLMGRSATTTRTLTVPKPPPPAPRDSTRTPPRRPPDR